MSRLRSKRILIDGVWLQRDMKGAGRYVFNVLRNFHRFQSDGQYWVLIRKENDLPNLPVGPAFHYIPVVYRNHFLHGLWELPRQARLLGADIAWVPYEVTLGPMPCPYLIVCHDIPEKISEAQKEGGDEVSRVQRMVRGFDYRMTRKSMRKAARILCNSRYTGNWLRDRVGIQADRIHYAPCAPGADFLALSRRVNGECVRRRLDCPRGYILVFWTGDGRENFRAVPAVFQRILDAGLPSNLLVAGVREAARPLLESFLSGFSWAGRVRIISFLGAGREQELAELYSAADLFLDPSLHEGFGMQVIEAMACRTPVVCSNRGALPEVAGDGAILVDPDKPGEMASAAIRLLSVPELKRDLVARGFAQAGKFSWERTARTISQALEEVSGDEIGRSESNPSAR